VGSLIGLKNMLIFSAVILTIVSAQQAFAGVPCQSINDGNWNNASNWSSCEGITPNATTDANIDFNDIIITGDEEVLILVVTESGTLFIDCDASLNLFGPFGIAEFNSNITNHGTFTNPGGFFDIRFGSNFFNSGTFSGVVEEGGSIVPISTICTQPIGGTVGSMSTTSLLVAGAQANMGLWIIALVGVVAVVGIAYKAKTNKTNKETL